MTRFNDLIIVKRLHRVKALTCEDNVFCHDYVQAHGVSLPAGRTGWPRRASM